MFNNDTEIASYTENEESRLESLAELPLSYRDLEKEFQEIVKIAHKVAGTQVAAINILDTCMQWSVATEGISFQSIYRDESVCQFTILKDEPFEVKNLTENKHFSNKFYVKGGPKFKYYYGIPFRDHHRHTLGTLCILDDKEDALSSESKDILWHLAGEIENKIDSYVETKKLLDQLSETKERIRITAHDIRNPISSVVTTCQLLEQDPDISEDNMELITLMREQSESLIAYTDEVLNTQEVANDSQENIQSYTTIKDVRDDLINLYKLFAERNNHRLEINIDTEESEQKIPLNKNIVIQIAGNLLANAIKFTPSGGHIYCSLQLNTAYNGSKKLKITVKDDGVGMDQDLKSTIVNGQSKKIVEQNQDRNHNEKGYGIGLKHVVNQVKKLDGTIDITSESDEFTQFDITLPA